MEQQSPLVQKIEKATNMVGRATGKSVCGVVALVAGTYSFIAAGFDKAGYQQRNPDTLVLNHPDVVGFSRHQNKRRVIISTSSLGDNIRNKYEDYCNIVGIYNP